MNQIVEEWTEFGNSFKIEKLDPPVKKGAGERNYRLYVNGGPALGWQWCYDIQGARRAARYLLEHDYIRRIEYLERQVHSLERRLFLATGGLAE
ncbi:hypothetical protein J2J97_32220 (plasmid) [Rhizobium bangladeshense]|uniref:hypothetical protein n=1 Tax=Rhizobium bangladeshense TaxID=1138189 RepID=UPI001A97E98C|nr:hypothetical protein [Rhizobium bangladeshense]QSY98572.1 hypothetical protein J2J97_32220 [Rhizobium bangladeshense]